jgi:hypothetical protein
MYEILKFSFLKQLDLERREMSVCGTALTVGDLRMYSLRGVAQSWLLVYGIVVVIRPLAKTWRSTSRVSIEARHASMKYLSINGGLENDPGICCSFPNGML